MLPVFKLEEVECCPRGIEVEMKRLLAARLTVGQAGKLFGITEQKFDVKTGLVVTINLQGGEEGIGGKQQSSLYLVAVLLHQIDDTGSAFEPDTVDYGGVDVYSLHFLDKFKPPEVVKFHLAVISFAAAPGLFRAGVEKAQIGVMPKFADLGKTGFHHPIGKLLFAVVAIGDEVMDCVGQGVPVLSEMLPIPVNPCLIWVLKCGRLAGGEVVRGGVFHVHQDPGRDFQTLLRLVVGAVVERVQTVGVVAAFFTEAAIHRRHEQSVPGKELCQSQTVELDKIKLPPKPSGIGLLTDFAVAA